LILYAEPTYDFFRDAENLPMKVKIENEAEYPLTLVIFRRNKFPFKSYKVVLTKGDVMEALL
jgi:hypothetical protein